MKRGQVSSEIFTVFAIILFLGMMLLIGHTLVPEIKTAIEDTGYSDAKYTEPLTKVGDAFGAMDYAILVMLLTSLAGIIIGFKLLDNNPMFLVFSLISFIIILACYPILSNLFDAYSQNSQLSPYASEIPVTARIIKEFPKIGLIAFGIIIVFAFGKAKGVV